MKNILVITSGKGGVGKTCTAVNLGAAINHFGKDVLIIDANLSTPNVGLHLNSLEVPRSLNHVLLKKVEPLDAVYEHKSGIKIMPSSISVKELGRIAPEKLNDFKKEFQKIADYIIVDSAAGLGHEAVSAIKLADEVIIITNPEMPAITDALKTIKLAEQMKKYVRGVIITRVRNDKIELQSDAVKEILETPIMGMIPEDVSVRESINLKDAVVHTHPHSKSALAYKEIAAQIINIKYDSDKDKLSWWRRVISW